MKMKRDQYFIFIFKIVGFIHLYHGLSNKTPKGFEIFETLRFQLIISFNTTKWLCFCIFPSRNTVQPADSTISPTTGFTIEMFFLSNLSIANEEQFHFIFIKVIFYLLSLNFNVDNNFYIGIFKKLFN